MPSAELIAIGTELLLGEIQDTNSRFLARQLRDIGVDLFRTTNIGDNATRIADAIRDAFTRADIVITTGGLGPTVDDPTREAAALAFDTTCEFHPELWQGIEARFLRRGITPTENNKRQAYIPVGALVIPNPVGTAPAFAIENDRKLLYCLPGVPKEMELITQESVLPSIKEHFHLHAVIKVRVIHLSGVGESAVDQPISEFEKMSNPTVGLLAHPGIVDVRITAKADDEATAGQMIAGIEAQIVSLFPYDVFGFDDQTLGQCINTICQNNDYRIHIQESGLTGQWPADLTNSGNITLESFSTRLDLERALKKATPEASSVRFYCNYYTIDSDSHLDYFLVSSEGADCESMIYNGPQSQGNLWAVNRAMDVLRRLLNHLTK